MKKTLVIIIVIIIGASLWFLRTRSDQTASITGVSRSITPSPLPTTTSSFTIKYPDGYQVYHSFPQESQELYTVENGKQSGFQIFITPFDESGDITGERILRDLPDAVINEPGWATLDGSKTLVYYGHDADIGDTFEAWVAHGGKLYQIMSRKGDEKLMSDALNTWRWK